MSVTEIIAESHVVALSRRCAGTTFDAPLCSHRGCNETLLVQERISRDVCEDSR